MEQQKHKSPFPWFGGKSKVASIVWDRFGPDVKNYIEPFAGSAAMLFLRPCIGHTETINDFDGLVSNFWRAVKTDPDGVAHWCDWPANENDLTARHYWLTGQRKSLQSRLEGNPDWFDVKIAGWWVWGIGLWIGSHWCNSNGPWHEKDGELIRDKDMDGDGVKRERLHLGDDGRGIHRKRLHLGNDGMGIHRQRLHLGNDGMGIHRQLLHLGDDGMGQCQVSSDNLKSYMAALSDRLRRVRVCCGDWSRICGTTPTIRQGTTAVFMDPPYGEKAGRADLYTVEDTSVAPDVFAWCMEHGDDVRYRICLCGYEGEHDMPKSWECVEWKTQGGYGNQGEMTGRDNRHRERLWFSPGCLKINDNRSQEDLF